MRKTIANIGLIILAWQVISHAADAAPEPSGVINVSDKPALDAAKGQTVTVEGRVVLAEWSRSGKVMTIEFEDSPHFMAAAFEKSRAKLDESFSGDIAATLSGAVIKLSGKLDTYGGKSEKYADALQIVLRDTAQLTIVTPAPATQPAAQ